MEERLIFLDTETTGRGPNDRLCQVAYHIGAERISQLYNPGMPIPPEASAVHHITNDMVQDKPPFQESDEWRALKSLLEDDSYTIVAHNAPFDLDMLKRESIHPKQFICTLRIARHLDTKGVLPKYSLQYLRYLLELNVSAQAHDAAGDVLVLEQLFERLKQKIVESEAPEDPLSRLIEISNQPSLIKKFPFGKYINVPVDRVAREDPGYLEWLYKEKQREEVPDEDWVYTLEHYLKKHV